LAGGATTSGGGVAASGRVAPVDGSAGAGAGAAGVRAARRRALRELEAAEARWGADPCASGAAARGAGGGAIAGAARGGAGGGETVDEPDVGALAPFDGVVVAGGGGRVAALVSAPQSGCASATPALRVRFAGFSPSSSMTHTSRSPERSLEKAIFDPSGENAGETSLAGSFVKRVGAVPSAFMT
jgi:hypothetical protein